MCSTGIVISFVDQGFLVFSVGPVVELSVFTSCGSFGSHSGEGRNPGFRPRTLQENPGPRPPPGNRLELDFRILANSRHPQAEPNDVTTCASRGFPRQTESRRRLYQTFSLRRFANISSRFLAFFIVRSNSFSSSSGSPISPRFQPSIFLISFAAAVRLLDDRYSCFSIFLNSSAASVACRPLSRIRNASSSSYGLNPEFAASERKWSSSRLKSRSSSKVCAILSSTERKNVSWARWIMAAVAAIGSCWYAARISSMNDSSLSPLTHGLFFAVHLFEHSAVQLRFSSPLPGWDRCIFMCLRELDRERDSSKGRIILALRFLLLHLLVG